MPDFAAEEKKEEFSGGFYNRDTFLSRETLVLILQTGVSGMSYYVDTSEDSADAGLLTSLTEGTELKLFREPGNEHDRWAVTVNTVSGKQIGYITRFKNETLARLLDAGKEIRAYVGKKPEIPDDGDERRRLFAPTERFEVPVDIFMVEHD